MQGVLPHAISLVDLAMGHDKTPIGGLVAGRTRGHTVRNADPGLSKRGRERLRELEAKEVLIIPFSFVIRVLLLVFFSKAWLFL